jgi:hypothetical protein
MSDGRALRFDLRAIAVAIAVAAVIDPEFTRARTTRPVIAVVSADTVRHAARVAAVRQQLANWATVVHAPLTADASVLVGDVLPASAPPLRTPRFVASAASATSVHLLQLRAPVQVPLDARVTLTATLAHADIRARPVTLQLRQQGRVVSESQATLAPRVHTVVSLDWTPPRLGAQRVELRVIDARDTLRAERLVTVDSSRWRVLAYDPRPSWMSTFVRRALERDARFAVSSRVITSTNISRASGAAPVALSSLDARAAGADVIVVGAPDALTAADVAALRRAMEQGGRAVVLLADHAAASPVDALVASGGWRTQARREPAHVTGVAHGGATTSTRDSIHLRGVAVGTPARLPANATVIAQLPDGAPVLWRMPVGRGLLVVSGAFDAWRYRDVAQSTFDATWRDLVADAALARDRTLLTEPAFLLARPGERLALHLHADTMPAATLDDRALAVYSTATPDRWLAVTDAPSDTGFRRLVVSAGSDTVIVPVAVTATHHDDVDDDPALVRAWAESGGGRVLAREHADSLLPLLKAAVRAAPHQAPWHPLRSPWWIVPFALALAGEWWLRRRRGLP